MVREVVALVVTALHPIGLDLNLWPWRAVGGATKSRGCSSAGRAPDLHSGGRRFDPDQLHQFDWASSSGGLAARRVNHVRTSDKGEAW